ncbi:MAG: SMC-Scp complex subunit ScpB [Pseudomonadota bacterium]
MNPQQLKNILEATLLAAGQPMNMEKLQEIFPEEARPDAEILREGLRLLEEECAGRGIELKEVGNGFRLQVKQEYAPWVARLSEEKAPRYSRALLETLVLIAYRQPISRAEIEDIRGVSVSTNIIKTLQEREWVRIVGHREVPGRPALYGTTRDFLDYFNLKNLSQLPALSEVRSLETIAAEIDDLLPPPLASAADEDGESASAPPLVAEDAALASEQPGHDGESAVEEIDDAATPSDSAALRIVH